MTFASVSLALISDPPVVLQRGSFKKKKKKFCNGVASVVLKRHYSVHNSFIETLLSFGRDVLT